MTRCTKLMVTLFALFAVLALGILFETRAQPQLVYAQSPDGHSLDAVDGDPKDAVFVDNDGDVIVQKGFLQVKTNVQEQPRYVIGAEAGLSVGWNYSGGHAEVNFWNSFAGHPALPAGDAFARGFKFLQQTDSGTPRELMWIKGDGNVGIGTTNPQGKLHVEGSNGSQIILKDNGDVITDGGINAGGNSGSAIKWKVLTMNVSNTTNGYSAEASHGLDINKIISVSGLEVSSGPEGTHLQPRGHYQDKWEIGGRVGSRTAIIDIWEGTVRWYADDEALDYIPDTIKVVIQYQD